MRFDSYTAILRFISAVRAIGYEPPFLDLAKLKSMLPKRINYYRCRLVVYTTELDIIFTDSVNSVVIKCIKEE